MMSVKNVLVVSILLLVWIIRASDQRDNYAALNMGYRWESYDPQLFEKIQSVNQLLAYSDTMSGFALRSSLQYADTLANVIRKRFYHGYSYYSCRQDWIAALAGELVSTKYAAVVLPDDILKFPMAACSQQSMVLIECFRRAGVPFRKIQFDNHFAMEGEFAGAWYFFDTDMEPQFPGGRASLRKLLDEGVFLAAYRNTWENDRLEKMLSHPIYGQAGDFPAPVASIFHKITHRLSFLSLFLATVLVFYNVVMLDFTQLVDRLVRNESLELQKAG